MSTSRLTIILPLLVIPAHTHAAELGVIVGGWSHHFIPDQERQALNQNQGTLGLELADGLWDLQASRLEDSFGCRGDEITGAKRWPVFSPQSWLSGGLMLGLTAAHRCSSFPTSVTREVWVGEINPGDPFATVSGGLTQHCHPFGNQYWQICDLYQKQTVRETQHLRWYLGLLPGAYIDFGSTVRAEITLVRSPWTGHHLVIYGQVAIKLFSF